MKEVFINTDDMEWEEAAGYPRGTRMCVLRRDESGRIRAMLMKLGPNFSIGGHTNTIDEQQLVLEGEFQSNGKTYRQGSYRFIPRGNSHNPWKSDKGAVLFVTWE